MLQFIWRQVSTQFSRTKVFALQLDIAKLLLTHYLPQHDSNFGNKVKTQSLK